MVALSQNDVKPQLFQTHRIIQPPDRTVIAACHEIGCAKWRLGWTTTVSAADPLVAWFRTKSRRTFSEAPTGDGRIVFRFDAGQRCFEEHRTRPQIFRVQGGGANTFRGLLRVHANGRDWAEDLHEHTGRLNDERQRG